MQMDRSDVSSDATLSPHFYNPSGDISSSSVARLQSVIRDWFPDQQGRRLIVLEGRMEW